RSGDGGAHVRADEAPASLEPRGRRAGETARFLQPAAPRDDRLARATGARTAAAARAPAVALVALCGASVGGPRDRRGHPLGADGRRSAVARAAGDGE